MKEILVLVEHRRGEIRDVTFEMLSEAVRFAKKIGGNVSALILGYGVQEYAKIISDYANQVLVVEDEKLKEFNSEAYQKVLVKVIGERKPFLTLIGHTAMGMDLAPALSATLNIPLTTDCICIDVEDGKFVAIRQYYGGKVNGKVVFKESESFMVTVRAGAFSPEKPEPPLGGGIISIPSPLTDEDVKYKKFIEYVEAEKGEVDISSADIIVDIGRGIKDAKNIPIVEEFAKAIGGVLACSRPVVDKGWLPKDRQIGISGKTVKPKLHIALGVSGAFQHVAGMKGGLIIAVNKDPKAPIFNVADYGIVEDMFKVIPILKDLISELKGKK